jgi:hypothetical protein
MRGLGDARAEDVVVYLTGGATAVLEGWRGTTDPAAFRRRLEDEVAHAGG